jgi:hypothetical protein
VAGIDLVTGKVDALVKDRHRSREFIEFLKLLDAAYPASTTIKLILDNHSAHISKETKAGSQANLPAVSTSPSRPSMARGSTSSKASSPRLPAPSCVISVSQPNRNSRIASWPQWITSIRNLSFTPGPTSLKRQPDMIRISETVT